jgi:hypothetical protein
MIHEARYPLAISALGILFLHNCNLMAVMHSMCVEAQDTWHCQLGEEEVNSDARQTMITPQQATLCERNI